MNNNKTKLTSAIIAEKIYKDFLKLIETDDDPWLLDDLSVFRITNENFTKSNIEKVSKILTKKYSIGYNPGIGPSLFYQSSISVERYKQQPAIKILKFQETETKNKEIETSNIEILKAYVSMRARTKEQRIQARNELREQVKKTYAVVRQKIEQLILKHNRNFFEPPKGSFFMKSIVLLEKVKLEHARIIQNLGKQDYPWINLAWVVRADGDDYNLIVYVNPCAA